MALKDDIAEVFSGIGTEIAIYKNSGEMVYGEYIDYDVNIRTSDPFHREAFLEAEFPWDTQANAGDVVEFVESGRKNVIMSKTPESFQNEVISYSCSIYKCNVSGELLRPTQILSGEYHYVNYFPPIKNPCYGLITNSNYNNYVATNEDFAVYGVTEMFFYCPHEVGIRQDDRYVPVSGELNYRVGSVPQFVYENTDMATLHRDTR